MDCSESRNCIEDSFDNGEPLTALSAEHLNTCAECSAYYQELTTICEVFTEIPEIELPLTLNNNIKNRVNSDLIVIPWYKLLPPSIVVPALLLIAGYLNPINLDQEAVANFLGLNNLNINLSETGAFVLSDISLYINTLSNILTNNLGISNLGISIAILSIIAAIVFLNSWQARILRLN